MPEGDSLHRAARRLQEIVGEEVEVETPHPRARVGQLAKRLDGRRLLGVEAVGKNLLLHFEGGYVVRSHLGMSGRWRVVPRGSRRAGRPWLVLRGREREAVLWHGPVLELHQRGIDRLGPDILSEPIDFDAMVSNMRADDPDRAIGEAVLDQRLVAGIGNMWKAEILWRVGVSPWQPVGGISDEQLGAILGEAGRLMRVAVETGRAERSVYRRAGRPCPRCGTPIVSRGQGEANRMAYWCPSCQGGDAPQKA